MGRCFSLIASSVLSDLRRNLHVLLILLEHFLSLWAGSHEVVKNVLQLVLHTVLYPTIHTVSPNIMDGVQTVA